MSGAKLQIKQCITVLCDAISRQDFLVPESSLCNLPVFGRFEMFAQLLRSHTSSVAAKSKRV